MILRKYQQTAIDTLYQWMVKHTGNEKAPIIVMPTGSGKSIVIAELCRLFFDTWPEEHPRTVILVPSKELAEQNADKLRIMLPPHLRLGYYSASLGRKVPDADVIVATIGSIYRDAHLLGNIKMVLVDECHLINPNGFEAGRYRQFLTDLGSLCDFRVVGFTATPFRGDGVWITDGEYPLFTGIACTIKVQELLNDKYLSPLVLPSDVIETRIDTKGIKTVNGDYNIAELSDRVTYYLPGAADDACKLARDRKKWIAFCASVDNAEGLVRLLTDRDIPTALVCGETPALEREQNIADFRSGKLRCLVTVLALSTGFDVPDVDCILWLRPTQSPVLYVQAAGRGMRIAEGKVDCLWVDFSDTTDRLGPVDDIRGRKKRKGDPDQSAPYAICPNTECSAKVVPASAKVCPYCGTLMREEEIKLAVAPSNAPIMLHQVAKKINTYPVTRVDYAVHQKEGSPDSMRVDYYCGLRRVASEWVCFEHAGFARAKAEQWLRRRSIGTPTDMSKATVDNVIQHKGLLKTPTAITINETGKYPEIIKFEWSTHDTNRTESHERRTEKSACYV